MLKYRLLFGTLMTLFFTGVVLFDGWLDGSLTTSTVDDKPVQGSLLCVLIAILAIPAQLEMSRLAAAKHLKIFTPVAIIASILFAGSWYWQQFIAVSPGLYVLVLCSLVLLVLLLYQYIYYGATAVIANCGANYFSIVYLGLLSGFVLGIRVDFGLWPLVMFVFVVKGADIGAYVIGTSFGRHRFSPKISPAKSWEGMAGGAGVAVIVSTILGISCGIMVWWLAVIFGVCFAFIGQMGDLVESMMKRDAEQKHSANHLPGFGGILDIIDSPLLAAPLAYLFFLISLR